MQKVYKTSIIRVAINLVMSVAAGFFAGLVVWYFAGKNNATALIATVVVMLLALWLNVFGSILTVTVDGDILTVKRGKKTQQFDTSRCSIRSQTKSDSAGIDTSCKLTITDENGVDHYIDCDLLGISAFHRLLDDIGVTGEKSQVIKLDTGRHDK